MPGTTFAGQRDREDKQNEAKLNNDCYDLDRHAVPPEDIAQARQHCQRRQKENKHGCRPIDMAEVSGNRVSGLVTLMQHFLGRSHGTCPLPGGLEIWILGVMAATKPAEERSEGASKAPPTEKSTVPGDTALSGLFEETIK